MAIAAGLGLFVGAAALGTGSGQRFIAAVARHLPESHAMTSLEKDILENHYTMKAFLDFTRGEAKRRSAMRAFSDSGEIRDALVRIGRDGYSPSVFLRAHNNPSMLAEEILKDQSITMDRGVLEDRLKRAVHLGRDERQRIQQTMAAAREQFNAALLKRYSPNKGVNGFRLLTVGDALAGKIGFTESYLSRGMGKGGRTFQERMLARMARNNREFQNAVMNPGLFMTKNGEVADLRAIGTFLGKAREQADRFHLPFVGISPTKLIGNMGLLRKEKDMPFMRLIKKGSVQTIFGSNEDLVYKEVIPNLGTVFRTKQDMLYIGGKVVSAADPSRILAHDIHLEPSQYGHALSTITEVLGLSTKDLESRNAFMKALDIGGQEPNAFLKKLLNIRDKHSNPNWEGNFINNILSTDDLSRAGVQMRKMRDSIIRETRAMPDTVFNSVFGEKASQLYGQQFDLTTNEGIINAFEVMANTEGLFSNNMGETFLKEYRKFKKNPYSYLGRTRAYSNKVPDTGMAVRFFSSTEQIEKIQDVKKLIQQELMEQAASGLRGEEVKSLSNRMLALSGDVDTQGAAVNLFMGNTGSAEVKQVLGGETETLGIAAKNFMEERFPWYEYGPMDPTAERVLSQIMAQNGDSYLLVRNPYKVDYKDLLRAFNFDDQQAGAEARGNLKKVVGQFFAGRNNMEDFTSASMFWYHMPFGRIQEAFTHMGIGLSPEHTGSAMDLLGNLILRRWLPITAGVFYAGYLSSELKKLTGHSAVEIGSDIKEDTREGYARVRDFLGITNVAKRLQSLTPGSEMIWEIPGLNFLDPSKSYDDVVAERDGQTPIRKGRYWTLSNTPFTGGKVEYYLPSGYRRAHADYKFTDVQYGSRDEYYKNAWLPTIEHPLAPFRHFVFDPYHYDKKHYKDRPYPTTGPINELEDVPIVGPILSGTVGNILKPARKMHKAEMRSAAKEQVADINEQIVSSGNIAGYIGPTGQLELRSDAGPVGGVEEESSSGFSSEEGMAPYRVTMTRGSRGAGRRAVKSMNDAIIGSGGGSGILSSRVMLPARFQTGTPIDATGAIPSGSIRHGAAKIYYGMTEMSGIYGFFAQAVTGQPIDDMKVYQDSGRMNTLSRSFWDLNLGGLGSNASEIGRRFLPRERRFQEELDINPIPNTMPGWMPGANYFLNFRRGDPYQKIARGEARLPGGGFEALWNYHPDEMIVRASQAGKSEQEIINYLLNVNEGPLPSSVQDAMEEGTEIHRKLQSEWRKQGFLISAEEEVYDAEAKVSGHYDAILRTPNGPQIIDIKTVSQKRWDELQKQGKPFEEHADQVTLYMNALKINNAGILYYNRDTGEELFEGLIYDRGRHERIVKRLEHARATIRKMMDNGKISPFDLYDPLHRFIVLADVAPYSQEYKYYAKYVSAQFADITGTTGPDRAEKLKAKALIATVRKQVSQQKKDHRFFPYRFKNSRLETQTVHVTGVLDNGTFVTKEYPDTPFELGGISISDAKDADEQTEWLNNHIHPGSTLKIGYDPNAKPSTNSLGTEKVVAYEWGQNLNLKMIEAGLAKEKPNDWTPVGVNARFGQAAIGFGSLWESFAHLDTPFHTKFLHVASPLEEYTRRDVYGKSFQKWTVKDQLVPTVQGIMAKGMVGAAASGALLGMLMYGDNLAEKMKGAKWGAIGFAALAGARMLSEGLSGHTWIPKRRQKEREINEYFDILEYVKYQGLYEYAARKSKQQGFDIEKLYNKLESKKNITKAQRERINKEKKRLTVADKVNRREAIVKWHKELDKNSDKRERDINALRSARDNEVAFIENNNPIGPMRDQQIAAVKARYQEEIEAKQAYYYERSQFKAYYRKNPRIHQLNEKLNTLAQNKELMKLPPWAIMAIRYRQQSESTLYGATGGISQVMGALPKKEREYFAEFIKVTNPKERKHILSVVPENERRFLQSAWGMPQDKKPTLEEYFKHHYLPKTGWEGYSETKDLNDVKIKVINQEGLDLSEFGFWKQDQIKADEDRAPAVPVNHRAPGDVEHHLKQVLKGMGLTDIDVKVLRSQTPGVQMDVDITKDRRQEVTDYINNNLDTLL